MRFDKAKQPGRLLLNFLQPGPEGLGSGAGFLFILLDEVVRNRAGLRDQLLIGNHVDQGLDDSPVDDFQPGRLHAAGRAGVIPFNRAGTGFSSVPDFHIFSAHSAVDKAGERVDGL